MVRSLKVKLRDTSTWSWNRGSTSGNLVIHHCLGDLKTDTVSNSGIWWARCFPQVVLTLLELGSRARDKQKTQQLMGTESLAIRCNKRSWLKEGGNKCLFICLILWHLFTFFFSSFSLSAEWIQAPKPSLSTHQIQKKEISKTRSCGNVTPSIYKLSTPSCAFLPGQPPWIWVLPIKLPPTRFDSWRERNSI